MASNEFWLEWKCLLCPFWTLGFIYSGKEATASDTTKFWEWNAFQFGPRQYIQQMHIFH